MNRRAFFASLATAAVGVAVWSLVPVGLELDPERTLWVPRQKTIFLPSVEPVSAFTPEMVRAITKPCNTLLTIDLIAREALAVLKRNSAFSKLINREYDESFIERGSLGRTVRVHMPGRFV